MAVRSLERSNDKTDEQREIDALLNYSSLSQLLRTWHPVSFIAEGKSGSVFRVKNRQNGLLAAMKFSASPKRLGDCAPPGSDADYLNLNDYNDNCHEVEMMSRLQGKPHVIPFIDQPEFLKLTFANKDGEQVCQHAVLIVMPLCMNNAVWMPQASACIEGRMKLALHVSMALAGYESEGIRHRDIKPGNILYSYDGNFYLSDAGEAKAQSEKTTVGLRGTFAYMAPEVFSLNGQSLHRADPRSDIYSLGIVLYQLFNDGQLPFRDAEGYLTDDAVASLNRSRQATPDRSKLQLRSHEQLAIDLRQSGHVPPPPAHADPEMTGIILRCIAYSQDQRYQSARDLYQDLDAYCLRHAVEADAFLVVPPVAPGAQGKGGASVQKKSQKKPQKKSSGVSGRTVAIAGCSAALVALLGAGAALWLSAPEGTVPSPTATPYVTATPYITAAPTATAVPTWTPTVMPTNAPTAYVTSTPVITSAPTATAKPTATPTAKPTATPTPKPTATPTPRPTATPTPKPTATPTPRPTATPTPRPTATPTPKPTATPTPKPTATPAVTPMSLMSLQQDYQLPERQQVKVSGHLNMPVYTGPSTDFARAAKKKAVVDSGGAIWCYGKVGNWYLVEYEVTGGDHKGSYRRGYINGANLKVSITANETQIGLINLPVVITQKTGVTDEPYKGRKNLCTVNKGSTATLLFFDGDDACIQMKGTSAGLIQGYVPISCIALQN